MNDISTMPDERSRKVAANDGQDLARAKALSEIVLSWCTVLAILAGGIWAVRTYYSLYQPEIAEAAASRRFSRLSLNLDTELKETANGTFLFATVNVENIGTRPVFFSHRWEDSEHKIPKSKESEKVALKYHPPFAVYKVNFQKTGEVLVEKGGEVFSKSIPGHSLVIPPAKKEGSSGSKQISGLKTWELIRVGEVRKIPFVIRLREPGVYLAEYRVNVDMKSDEQTIYQQYTGKDKKLAVWSTRKYVVAENIVLPQIDPASMIETVESQKLEVISQPKASKEEEEEEEE